MAAMTMLELAWWAAAWSAGFAPIPFLGSHLVLAFAALAAAIGIRRVLRHEFSGASWQSVLLAGALVGAGASLFLPLKIAIPREIPFWLDVPLAQAERGLFGADPWLVLDRIAGWATMAVDRLYGLWLPVQTVVLFAVILGKPSAAKSRALIAYSLAWFVLGVAAAALLSSAGPLFYDRLFGGTAFAPLHATLRDRDAWMAMVESDTMWSAFESGRPGLVAGISAMPSMHVAISLWMFLAARSLAPRLAPIALLYALLVWLASVQLGWHYASDGVAGMLGMLGLWTAAGPLDRALGRSRLRD